MRTLDEAVTGGAIRSINFFNGRLLTGEDLSREQDANRRARTLLGQSLGDGVAHGLEVSPAAGTEPGGRPVVRVEAGLAVNRRGEALELPEPVQLSLAREPARAAGELEVAFTDCQPPAEGTYSAGSGVYLLTIASARAAEGRAPVSGLGNEEATCNTAFSVEGVKFRLLRLALPREVTDDRNKLRNRLAHLTFGTADPRRTRLWADPFGAAVERYGLLDDLRGVCLGDDEVPLGTLHWTAADGIRFVDVWSVRRRLTRPPADCRCAPVTANRRLPEAEAALLQFQAQVEEILRSESRIAELRASDRFDHLPPAGVLPVRESEAPSGFDRERFFGGQGSRDVATTDASLLAELLHESMFHDPIRVGDEERIQLYRIWENRQAVAAGRSRQHVVVFARRSLRYRGVARFQHARYGLSDFVPRVI